MTSPLIDENALLRRIEGIERQLRELGPSIAKSVSSIVEGLVAFETEDDSAAGFSLPTGSSAIVLSKSVTVPEGYTKAGIIAVGTLTATNGSGLGSYLYLGVDIDGSVGGINVNSSYALAGEATTVTGHEARYMTGLVSGNTITVNIYGKGDPAWGSASAAGVSILACFSR